MVNDVTTAAGTVANTLRSVFPQFGRRMSIVDAITCKPFSTPAGKWYHTLGAAPEATQFMNGVELFTSSRYYKPLGQQNLDPNKDVFEGVDGCGGTFEPQNYMQYKFTQGLLDISIDELIDRLQHPAPPPPVPPDSPSPPPPSPPPSPPPNPTVIVTPSPPMVSIPPPSAEPPSLNENVVSAVSTLVGYTSQEFDSDRRRAFRSGVANFLNGVGEADVQIIQVTDVIARRRKLFETQAPAIDVDYSVAVPSGSGETTMTVGAALRNDALVNSLKSEGLTSVTSMLTYVRAAPTTIQPPPPPSTTTSPTTPTTSTPVSPPANDTITPMDDTPDFSSERTAGLIAGAALIMFVSVAYQYRSKFFNFFRSLMWGRDLGKPSEDGLRDPPSRKSSLIDDSAALKEFTRRAD